MKLGRLITMLTLLAGSTASFSQTVTSQTGEAPRGLSPSIDKTLQSVLDATASDHLKTGMDGADLLEKSREAGLLTDWHLEGRYGNGGKKDFAHKFAPEQDAARQAGKLASRRVEGRRYEMVFPGGTFALRPESASLNGVFYANSSTYLTSGGDWNVFLESGAEAVVFVDGHRVLTRGPKARGVLRGKIHLESGYHLIMVKFTAAAAPFRVAILPLNSGSRRKNNTPYLQASPASEDMLANDVIHAPVAGSY